MSPGERSGGTIASDSELQSVIDLLSAKRYEAGGYEGNEDSLVGKEGQENYLYSPLDYRASHMGRYEGRRSDQDDCREDWSVPTGEHRSDGGAGAMMGSGGELAGKRKDEDSEYVVMSRERTRASSKSASNSPLRGEADNETEGKEARMSGREEHRHSSKGRPRKKKWNVHGEEDNRESSDREQPEISSVISKGFGQIIRSDLAENAGGGGGGEPAGGGMKLLRDSPGYRLGLRMYDHMKDDSDSERSG